MSKYPSVIILLALSYLQYLWLLFVDIKCNHADLLSVLDNQDWGLFRGEIEALLFDYSLKADVASIQRGVFYVHKYLVLLSVPNLQVSISCHADSVSILGYSLYNSDGFVKEGSLRETYLKSLFIHFEKEKTFLAREKVLIVTLRVLNYVVNVPGLCQL